MSLKNVDLRRESAGDACRHKGRFPNETFEDSGVFYLNWIRRVEMEKIEYKNLNKEVKVGKRNS